MKKTIKDFSLDFKTVILRCDLNVTIKDNKIVDDTRIKESLETIKYILDNNAKVVILSHLGKVKTLEDKEKNNLKIVCDRLNYYLDNIPKLYIFGNKEFKVNNKHIIFSNYSTYIACLIKNSQDDL